jgi:hypothetical protein
MASERVLGLTAEVLRKKFHGGMSVRNYKDNETVFSQGDKADAIFYIQSGTVKLTVVSARRKKAVNCLPPARQLFWRRLSRRTISADLHREISW